MIVNLKIISLLTIFSITQLYAINFSEDISYFIYNECTSCHRPSQIGAFLPLMNYEDVYSNRYWISYAIEGNSEERHGNPIMPPWPPDRSYSSFIGERYLSDEQVHTFLDWIDAGALQGDPNSEAPIPEFQEGSSIGQPDMVFQLSEPYFIEGNGEDDYRCFVIPTGFTEDKEIAAIEFRPDNTEAVHHSIITIVPSGYADNIDEQYPGYGYECYGGFNLDILTPIVDGYVPGMITTLYPNGVGDIIPANSDIIIQMHYAPLDTDQTDQSSINIFIKDEPIIRQVQNESYANPYFVLAPNQITEVVDSLYIPTDLSLIQILPHSHLLGKSWEIYSVSSNNDTTKIIKINDWDFDWQNFYTPEYMLPILSGSTLYMNAVYDNTSENLDNPNSPPEYVFWGDGTEDEMFFIAFRFLEYQEGDEYIYLGPNSEFLQGDVNLDNDINVLDIVLLVQFILEFQSPTNEQQILSDINNDNILNILDIVLLVDLILP